MRSRGFVPVVGYGRSHSDFSGARQEEGQTMPISISMVVVGTHLVVAVADRVPAFDIARSCKLDVAATSGLSVDQSLKNCVNDENRAQRQLVSQWSKFSASSRGTMHSAGEYWRYTKLRKPFDLLANEFMVPMTDSGDASGATIRRCSE
jgi:hypothetical protein